MLYFTQHHQLTFKICINLLISVSFSNKLLKMVQELKLKRDEKQKLDNDIQDQNELVCTQPLN